MLGLIPYGTDEAYPRRRFPFVTALLVVVNVIVFIYQLYLTQTGGVAALNDFISRYAVIPSHFLGGHWLDPTLITSLFLHGGLLHLGSNMLFLMAFGDNVEDRLGHLRYLLVYLLWGIAGSFTHILLNAGSSVPAIGASGAIAGVLGAYLVLYPGGNVRAFFFFFFFFTFTRIPAIIMIGLWFVMQLFTGIGSLGAATEDGGVAVWAHIGGFIAGLLTALLLANRPDYHDSSRNTPYDDYPDD